MSVVGRGQRARFTWRLAIDAGVLVVVCALVVAIVRAPLVLAAVDPAFASDALTRVAVAVGVGVVILAAVGARMLHDARLGWLAGALLLYCLVVLPWSVLAPTAQMGTGARLSRFLVSLLALVLLLFSLRTPRRPGHRWGWLLLVGGGAVCLLALLLPDVPRVSAVVAGPVPAVALACGWAAAAVVAVVDAARTGSTPRARIGLGLLVLAVGQVSRLYEPPAAGFVLPALRVVGLAVLLAGLWQLVQRGLAHLEEQNVEQQEALTAAAVLMEDAVTATAERDHELRNGLAGLAGITHLLSAQAEGPEHDRLRAAVLAELGRLRTLLDVPRDRPGTGRAAGEAGGGRDEPRGYPVAPMLEGLVALRRARGQDVTLDVDRSRVEPRAVGDSAVVAQVVTNLLANCERHAPGAPVRVRAASVPGGHVVVEVRDEGPGLPTGLEDEILERGTRDDETGGSGLGLHISRQLVEGQAGSLELRTVDDPRGTLARLILPAGVPEIPAADHSCRWGNDHIR